MCRRLKRFCWDCENPFGEHARLHRSRRWQAPVPLQAGCSFWRPAKKFFHRISLATWFGAFCAIQSLCLLAEDPGALYQKAGRLETEKRWREAAQIFESIKDNPNALFCAGLDWESAGDDPQAERVYHSILKKYPDSQEALKGRFILAIKEQKKFHFVEMESHLLWFFHAPKETLRRPEALWLLGGHYIVVRGDRWAAYGCFETLRKDYPTHPWLKMAVSSWKQIENMDDLDLWSSVLARWQPTGRLPDRLPLFLLNKSDIDRIGKPAPKS